MTTLETLQARLCDRVRLVSSGDFEMLEHLPRLECADGFSVSMQASRFNYCSPRDDIGPWHTVELGYPSERVEEWMEYVEDAERPMDTVYAGVPLAVVACVIDAHGGLKP